MDKVDELRKQLKDAAAIERSSTVTTADGPPVSATSSDIERYAPDQLNQDGHSVQPVSRPGIGTVSVSRAISDPQRKPLDFLGSLAPGNLAERRTNRRSGKDNGQDRSDGNNLPASPTGTFERSEQVRKVGNLETDEPIPPRFFDAERETAIEKSEAQGTPQPRKRGRPPKQRNSELVPDGQIAYKGPGLDEIEQQKQRKFFASGGKTLSKAEAKELAEPLVSALTDELNQIDKWLWKYTGDPLEQPVWSDITENEMQNLANSLLKLGQKSPAVATVTRGAVDASDYIVAASVVGPRFMKTAEIIRDTRKKRTHDRANRPSTLERLRERRKQTT